MDEMPVQVRAAFESFPEAARDGLLHLRGLIGRIAAGSAGATPLEETLRWGEPAYIAPEGSTIRLGVPKSGGFALFVTCSTSLIEDFRPMAPPGMRFEGTRAVLFRSEDEIDEAALSVLIRAALTYKSR